MRFISLFVLLAGHLLAGFSFSRSITIDHTKLTGTVSDFPVAIAGTYSYLATVANGGKAQNASGYDIGFYTDAACTAGNKMAWETEKYSATTGAVVYWVKVASISSSVDTVVYVCYGDAGITTDQSAATSVWVSTFKGVYHLKESPTGGAPQHADSTTNAAHLTVTTTSGTPATVTGAVGDGVNYPTTSQYDGTTASSSGNVGISGTTNSISGWVYINSFISSDGYPQQLFGTQGASGIVVASGSTLAYSLNNGGTFGTKTTSATTIAAGGWHHFAGVTDGTNMNFYVDGASVATLATGSINDAKSVVGGNATNTIGFRFWDARFDEVRLSTTAFSAHWVKAEYNNQNSPATFYSISAEVSLSTWRRRVIVL